ncbi:hypothetical protein Cadr_000003354, partial [Camelus dromedarius]
MIKHVSIQLGLWLPTVISNLKDGSHQLQVRTLDLVKPKRMKEHLQLKAHGDKQPQEWEPPTSSQDIRPGKAKEDEGASAVEGEGEEKRNASCVCVC